MKSADTPAPPLGERLEEIEEPDMNLWTCPKCGLVIDIGTDDLAGDENVVRQRMGHRCVEKRGEPLSAEEIDEWAACDDPDSKHQLGRCWATVRALRAEPTEAQVEAAAEAIMDVRYGWNRPHLGVMQEAHQEDARKCARSALNAAHVASAAAESEAAALRAERDGLRGAAEAVIHSTRFEGHIWGDEEDCAICKLVAALHDEGGEE